MEELLRQLHGYVRGMWQFRWWGLALAWVAGIASAIGIYLMPDRYESTARVFVDTQSVLQPLMSGLAVQPNVSQQVAMLSRTLITRPNIEKLISMADLDHRATTPDEREALITSLTNNLHISGTGRDNLFTLSHTADSPQGAQRVVQALVSLFVESGLVNKRQDTTAARRFIEEQIRNYEEKLTEAENRMKDFRLRNMLFLGDGARDFVGRISDATVQLNQAQLELREAENARDALQRQVAGEEPVLLPETARTPGATVPEIDARIATLKQNLDSMLLRYTDDHPDVVGARRVIAELEEQKRQEIEKRGDEGAVQSSLNSNPVFQQMKLAFAEAEARVASLRARVNEYESRLQTLQAQAEKRPQIEAEMTQLDRDYEIHKRNYESLVARRESAKMSVEMGAQGGVADFRLIDPPSLPTTPTAPNRVLLIPLAGLGSILAGMLFSLLVSQLRPSFGDPRTLREITGLPVLGAVSLLPNPGRLRRQRRVLFAFVGGVGGFVGAMIMMTVTVHLVQG